MGALEGAIIGGVAGGTVAIFMAWRRRVRRKELIQTLHRDGWDAARSLVDKRIPPLRKIPLSRVLRQRERMATLALLDDPAAIEAELAGHDGPLLAVAQVAAVALFGVAVRKDAADGARRLKELVVRIDTEGGAMLRSARHKTMALAELAGAMATEPLTPDVRSRAETLRAEGGLVWLMVSHGLARALARGGHMAEAEAFAAQVRQSTTAFERSPRQAGEPGKASAPVS